MHTLACISKLFNLHKLTIEFGDLYSAIVDIYRRDCVSVEKKTSRFLF